MSKSAKASYYMRVFHRYLGFFLAGIMAVYAISGIVLVFRNTDFLKKKIEVAKTIETNLSGEAIGKKLKIKGFKVDKKEGTTYYFKQGSYNSQTGLAKYQKKELPYVLGKMTHLHKATTKDP